MNSAFLTGSRVYGRPRDDSDVDLVVLMTKDEMAALARHGSDIKDYGTGSLSVRFGILNIVAVSSPAEYEAWRDSKNALLARRPVTRDDAVDVTRRRIAAARAVGVREFPR